MGVPARVLPLALPYRKERDCLVLVRRRRLYAGLDRIHRLKHERRDEAGDEPRLRLIHRRSGFRSGLRHFGDVRQSTVVASEWTSEMLGAASVLLLELPQCAHTESDTMT